MWTSFKAIPAENDPIFPAQEPRNIYEKRRIFHENRTYQETESHGSFLQCQRLHRRGLHPRYQAKKRLLAYAAQFPELCQQTDDDEQGGLRFEIDKSRISIRLTAPYSEERRNVASKLAMETNIFIN